MITREFSDNTNKRLGQFFLFLAFVCLGLTLWAYSVDREFIRTAHLTKGEVIGVEKNRTWPTIKYRDSSGSEVTFRPNSRSSADDFTVGEVLEVLHNNKAPIEAKLNQWSHLWSNTLGAATFCAFLSIFAALTLRGKVRWGPLKQTRIVGGGS